MSEKNDRVPASSVVMKALDAKTFSELEAFVKDLEGRPDERLLRDLPELVGLSETKASLIAGILAARFRHADPEGRRTIRASVSRTLEELPPGADRDRVFEILKRFSGA